MPKPRTTKIAVTLAFCAALAVPVTVLGWTKDVYNSANNNTEQVGTV